MGKKMRQYLLNAALAVANAAAFLMLNVVMWRNHLWDERRWAIRNYGRSKSLL